MDVQRLIGCILAQMAGGSPFLPAVIACLFEQIVDDGNKPPDIPSPGNVDPLKARCQVRHGNAGCTAVFLPSNDAEFAYLLSAYHCVPGVGGTGEARTTYGETFRTKVIAGDQRSDVAILTSQEPYQTRYFAELAEDNAPAGTPIWHAGYGIDRPGNVERGQVIAPDDGNGQTRMQFNVSSGDSGGGIYREDNGQIISTVCCGDGRNVWGANVQSIRRVLSEALKLNRLRMFSKASYISGYKIED